MRRFFGLKQKPKNEQIAPDINTENRSPPAFAGPKKSFPTEPSPGITFLVNHSLAKSLPEQTPLPLRAPPRPPAPLSYPPSVQQAQTQFSSPASAKNVAPWISDDVPAPIPYRDAAANVNLPSQSEGGYSFASSSSRDSKVADDKSVGTGYRPSIAAKPSKQSPIYKHIQKSSVDSINSSDSDKHEINSNKTPLPVSSYPIQPKPRLAAPAVESSSLQQRYDSGVHLSVDNFRSKYAGVARTVKAPGLNVRQNSSTTTTSSDGSEHYLPYGRADITGAPSRSIRQKSPRKSQPDPAKSFIGSPSPALASVARQPPKRAPVSVKAPASPLPSSPKLVPAVSPLRSNYVSSSSSGDNRQQQQRTRQRVFPPEEVPSAAWGLPPFSRASDKTSEQRKSSISLKQDIPTHTTPEQQYFGATPLEPGRMSNSRVTSERRRSSGVQILIEPPTSATEAERLALEQKFFKESQKLRDMFDNEVARIREVLESRSMVDHSQFQVNIYKQFESLAASYQAKLQEAQQEMRAHTTEAANKAQAEALGQMQRLRLSLDHLLDVNNLSRRYIEQMRDRESLLLQSIENGRKNEEKFRKQLGLCIPIQTAKQLVAAGFMKGQALRIWLLFDPKTRALREAFQDLRDQQKNVDTMNVEPRKHLLVELSAKATVEKIVVAQRRNFASQQLCSVVATMSKLQKAAAFYKMNLKVTVSSNADKKVMIENTTKRERLVHIVVAALKKAQFRIMITSFYHLFNASIDRMYPPQNQKPFESRPLQPSTFLHYPTKGYAAIRGWDIPYYQHKLSRRSRPQREGEFVALQQVHKPPPPIDGRESSLATKFLKEQFSVGLPLVSKSFKTGREVNNVVLDYRKMPLGSLGTGGGGYVRGEGDARTYNKGVECRSLNSAAPG